MLHKLVGTGLSYQSVSKVRFAMGDVMKTSWGGVPNVRHFRRPEDAQNREAVGSFAPCRNRKGGLFGTRW